MIRKSYKITYNFNTPIAVCSSLDDEKLLKLNGKKPIASSNNQSRLKNLFERFINRKNDAILRYTRVMVCAHSREHGKTAQINVFKLYPSIMDIDDAFFFFFKDYTTNQFAKKFFRRQTCNVSNR